MGGVGALGRLRRSVLGFGGGLCLGTSLIWYHRRHIKPLSAVSAAEPAEKRWAEGRECLSSSKSLHAAGTKAREILQRVKDEYGCPGIVASVSVNGERVWSDAIGYADVENQLPMTPRHMLRIASISKVLSVTALAKLWEDGKVDIDRPIQAYVPAFPEKEWEGKKVPITTRQILSHLSGIRHYFKEETDSKVPSISTADLSSSTKKNVAGQDRKSGDSKYPEFYSTTEYKSVTAALDQFKDDPLVHKPGTEFLYSTHAWTLVSAVIESAAGKPYLDVMKETFKDLGLSSTIPDHHKPIIAYRSRAYKRNPSNSKLENAPYVNLSGKWAGGGFLSTVDDMVQFGDAMLYSYQYSPSCTNHPPGYLKPETIQKLWVPVEIAAEKTSSEGRYGLGWKVIDKPQKYGCGCPSKHFAFHLGGAVGASSALLVAPGRVSCRPEEGGEGCHIPRGVSVAVFVNINGVSLEKAALDIARLFENV